MLEDDQIKIVMLMHELENLLGELYALFSESFPEHDNLWKVLIKEEQEHAEAVRTLYKLTYQGESYFNGGHIRPPALESVIQYVKEACDRAKLGKFNAVQALGMSFDIESSIVAKDIFYHFEVSQEFSRLIEHLRNGSEWHAQLVKKELDNVKKG